MSADSPLTGFRVLVIDDDQDTLEIECLFLRSAGADVRCVCSVAEAHHALETMKPDAIVTDLSMPVTNGYELLEELQGSWKALGLPHVPVLLLTAHAEDGIRMEALARGFAAVLIKPIEPPAFVTAVMDVVGTPAHAN